MRWRGEGKWLFVMVIGSVFYWLLFSFIKWPLVGVGGLYTLAILVFSIVYFKERRHHIQDLVDYLDDMNRGIYRLNIEKYTEGELSILRSSLYKTMVTLQTKNDQLLDQKNFLSKTMADIAHQLRTPITSMMMLVDLLDNHDLSEQQRLDFTQKLQDQLDRYRWLVSALMVMSRIDAKMIVYTKTEVRDDVLVNRVLVDLALQIEAKDLEVQADYALKTVVADQHWTREAILNSVKNAIDHADPGSVLTIISKVDPMNWTLTVRNTGDSIDDEDLAHAFERFYRGKNAVSGSFGIGLAMTYALITQQSGTVRLSALEPQVCLFTMTLPLLR